MAIAISDGQAIRERNRWAVGDGNRRVAVADDGQPVVAGDREIPGSSPGDRKVPGSSPGDRKILPGPSPTHATARPIPDARGVPAAPSAA